MAGEVLDVTSFLADHPGGELSVLTVADRGATMEFNTIWLARCPTVAARWFYVPATAPGGRVAALGAGTGLEGALRAPNQYLRRYFVQHVWPPPLEADHVLADLPLRHLRAVCCVERQKVKEMSHECKHH